MYRKLFVALIITSAVCIPARAEDSSFDSGGVKIHYTVEGQGDPVILVHGFIANINLQWRAPGIIKELAKQYKVIALDNRGHGQSDKPHDPAKYGVEMVEDIVRLMDHLKIQKAHIVGYSMGGFITAKLLALHPERVRSATLGGAAWFGETLTGNLTTIADSLDNGKGLEPLLVALTPEGEPRPSDEQIKTISQMALSFNDPKALSAAARGMKKLAVSEDEMKNNRVPTLVLMGDKDPLKAGVEPLQKMKPNLEVFWQKGANHMDAFARPEFTKKLVEFLKGVEAAEKGLKKAG